MTDGVRIWTGEVIDFAAMTDEELAQRGRPDLGVCYHAPDDGIRPRECGRCQALREMGRRQGSIQ